ncbi:MAG: hypothetical protein ABI557_06450, partial [Aureliella sp.]
GEHFAKSKWCHNAFVIAHALYYRQNSEGCPLSKLGDLVELDSTQHREKRQTSGQNFPHTLRNMR